MRSINPPPTLRSKGQTYHCQYHFVAFSCNTFSRLKSCQSVLAAIRIFHIKLPPLVRTENATNPNRPRTEALSIIQSRDLVHALTFFSPWKIPFSENCEQLLVCRKTSQFMKYALSAKTSVPLLQPASEPSRSLRLPASSPAFFFGLNFL